MKITKKANKKLTGTIELAFELSTSGFRNEQDALHFLKEILKFRCTYHWQVASIRPLESTLKLKVQNDHHA